MSDSTPRRPFQSAVMPAALTAESEISLRCYKGISCFNACCKQADVTLAPYDVLRLTRRLGITTTQFVRDYAVPFQMDSDGLPGLKLKTDDTGVCSQLKGSAGCAVYSDRPTVCRYYPIALLALREQDAAHVEERYSLIKEAHCKAHDEPHGISLSDYRVDQGCDAFDAMNREWYQLILKKQSAGPAVGRPPQASLQLFFMASYDLDTFRRFVLSHSFRSTYELPDDVYADLEQSDESLLRFSYRFLRQVLFGERTIPEAHDAWARRVQARKDVWDAKRRIELERAIAAEDAKYREDAD